MDNHCGAQGRNHVGSCRLTQFNLGMPQTHHIVVRLKLRHHGTSQLAVGSGYYNPHDVPTCHNSLVMVEHHTVHVNINHTLCDAKYSGINTEKALI